MNYSLIKKSCLGVLCLMILLPTVSCTSNINKKTTVAEGNAMVNKGEKKE